MYIFKIVRLRFCFVGYSQVLMLLPLNSNQRHFDCDKELKASRTNKFILHTSKKTNCYRIKTWAVKIVCKMFTEMPNYDVGGKDGSLEVEVFIGT